jgi:hypothetical protein
MGHELAGQCMKLQELLKSLHQAMVVMRPVQRREALRVLVETI